MSYGLVCFHAEANRCLIGADEDYIIRRFDNCDK